MKILAIRGQNIASLAEFEVDLQSDPLARAGLFALTGPTGSGKSTILDALCLALFDETPRLQGNSGVRPGRGDDDERLTVTDVRNLLRRGAAEGHAEVDFLGKDGQRYRARWEVWRARRRADGKLQPQTLSLTNLDTEAVLGDNKKTETKNEIAERLGLTFDQFRRSALLAQGDFAAFLRADEGARSDLLEAMTGTDIYTRISKQAYFRAKNERGTLAGLRGRVEAVEVLGDAERQDLVARAGAAAEALPALRQSAQQAQAWVTWHEEGAEREAGVAQATAALQGARERSTALADLRAEVEAAQQAAPLRGVVEAADARAHDREQAQAALGQLTEQVQQATASVDQAEQAATSQRAALQAAREARAQAEPVLREAARLDDRITESVSSAETARAQAATAAAQAKRSQTALTQLDQRREAQAVARGAAEAWLSEHDALGPLHDRWELWVEHLDTLVEVLPAVATAAQAHEGAAEATTRAAAAVAAARETFEQAATAASDADRAAQQAESAAAARPRAAIDTRIQALDARREALAELTKALDDLAQVDQDRAEVTQRLEDHAAADARARADQAAAHEAKVRLDGSAREAERRLRQLRARGNVEVYRPDLRSGEPCPLCGAEEHPWALAPVAADQELMEATARVAELKAQREAELKRVQAAQTRRRSAAEQRTLEAAKLERLATRRDALAARRDGLWAPARLERVEAQAQAIVLETTEAVNQQRDAEVAALMQVAALDKAAERARGAARAARAALEAARTQRDTHERAHRTAAETLAQRQRDHAALQERATVAAERLAPILGPRSGGLTALQADPVAFRARCASERETYARQRATFDAAAATLAELDGDRKGLVATASADADAAQQRHAEAEAAAKTLAQHRAARAVLFAGTPHAERATADIEARLKAAVVAAERAAEAAAQALSTAHTTLARVSGNHKQAESQLTQASTRAQQAAAARDAALAVVGLDLAAVRARLARGPDWLPQATTQLEAAAKALDQAATVLHERTTQRAHHAQRAPAPVSVDGADPAPLQPAETARAAAQRAQDALQRATERQAALRAQLSEDDKKRARTADLQSDIDAQQAVVDHWRILEDLIGSADGKKFRTFAQSLTLDALLLEANHHLERLSPRYRVERIPGHDLEIQLIDHHMADEVRGVHSLSGGESFLVSLALALGLSNLSAQDTPVETLFIDEGFGTLDRDTLGVALSTLDQLQSEGRQVGLISHVDGLAESIGARVMVEPQGNGRSRVRVLGPGDQ